jgi:CheY-like chemotaxis protein
MRTNSHTTKKQITRILCVDDDDDDASLLETVVTTLYSGIEFVKCYGGIEALEVLRTSIVDIILLDVNMPILNGFDCLKEIRKERRLRNIPIFMLSTSASQRDVALALELGARKFLTKPNSYGDICAMVGEIIYDCREEVKIED